MKKLLNEGERTQPEAFLQHPKPSKRQEHEQALAFMGTAHWNFKYGKRSG